MGHQAPPQSTKLLRSDDGQPSIASCIATVACTGSPSLTCTGSPSSTCTGYTGSPASTCMACSGSPSSTCTSATGGLGGHRPGPRPARRRMVDREVAVRPQPCIH
jgi:hypothetical protein